MADWREMGSRHALACPSTLACISTHHCNYLKFPSIIISWIRIVLTFAARYQPALLCMTFRRIQAAQRPVFTALRSTHCTIDGARPASWAIKSASNAFERCEPCQDARRHAERARTGLAAAGTTTLLSSGCPPRSGSQGHHARRPWACAASCPSRQAHAVVPVSLQQWQKGRAVAHLRHDLRAWWSGLLWGQGGQGMPRHHGPPSCRWVRPSGRGLRAARPQCGKRPAAW